MFALTGISGFSFSWATLELASHLCRSDWAKRRRARSAFIRGVTETAFIESKRKAPILEVKPVGNGKYYIVWDETTGALPYSIDPDGVQRFYGYTSAEISQIVRTPSEFVVAP